MAIVIHEFIEINARLLDGLIFCRKVYRLFEEIRGSQDGIKRLRLRKERLEKRLVEEILPVARYVQLKYGAGQKIKVKWIDGSQNYDAYLLFSGPMVEEGIIPRKQFLEITTAVSKKDHLVRYHLDKKGYAFGAKGTRRDKTTKEIISEQYIYRNNEAYDDLVSLITDRIEEKSKKNYPDNTSLVIQCVFDIPFHDSEWCYVINQVKKTLVTHKFREICLFDCALKFFTTL